MRAHGIGVCQQWAAHPNCGLHAAQLRSGVGRSQNSESVPATRAAKMQEDGCCLGWMRHTFHLSLVQVLCQTTHHHSHAWCSNCRACVRWAEACSCHRNWPCETARRPTSDARGRGAQLNNAVDVAARVALCLKAARACSNKVWQRARRYHSSRANVPSLYTGCSLCVDPTVVGRHGWLIC